MRLILRRDYLDYRSMKQQKGLSKISDWIFISKIRESVEELKQGSLKTQKPKVVLIREKLEQWLNDATDVLIRYLRWIQFWKEFYKPNPEEEWHELFTEALANERRINDYLDVLMFGTGEEIIDFSK